MQTTLRTVLEEKTALLAERGHSLFQVAPDASIAEAARIMSEANIGCVLVMDQGRLVGVFNEHDLLVAFADAGSGAATQSVASRLASRPITVTPSMSVEQAMLECTDRRVRHLPVCEDDELVGLLSIGDLVRFVVKDKENTISELMDYIHGP